MRPFDKKKPMVPKTYGPPVDSLIVIYRCVACEHEWTQDMCEQAYKHCPKCTAMGRPVKDVRHA